MISYKHLILIVVFLSILVGFGCIKHQEKFKAVEECISDKDNSLVSGLEKLQIKADSWAVKHSVPLKDTVLVEATCKKRIYKRGTFILEFWIYQNNSRTFRRIYRAKENIPSKMIPKKCIAEAIDELDKVGVDFVKTMFDLFKSRYVQKDGDHWLEIASGFLKCRKEKDKDYFTKLLVFVHEINHFLRKDGNIYSCRIGKYLKFKLGKDLPKREIAKFEQFPTNKEEELSLYNNIQNNYINRLGNMPLILLFDELNAFTSTLEVLTALLKAYGNKAVFYSGKGEKYTFVHIPLFLNYVLRYLHKLKSVYPNLYERYFIKNPSNMINALILCEEGESVYRKWLSVMEKNGREQMETEAKLWKMYHEEKKKVFKNVL